MKLQKFISDEIGAITVDWVVLTALVVGLGGVTVLALGGTKEDGIATMAMNRPEALNALTSRMIDELVAAIENAKQDNEVRVVVLTGVGRGFCSGMDVKALAASMPSPEAPLVDRRNELRESVHRVPRALADLDKPLIGSINGAAAGAGMALPNYFSRSHI